MKKWYYIFFLAMFTVLAGCKNENIDYGSTGSSNEKEGYLLMGAFNLQVANYAEEISTSSVERKSSVVPAANTGATIDASDDYRVKIRSVKNGDELEYTYADLKKEENQRIPLAPGSYVVSAQSANYEEYTTGEHYADWDMPVYFGSVNKSIIKRTETSVNDLVCMLANIKATVVMTPELQSLFMSDAECESQGREKLSVTLSIGENSLKYDRQVSGLGTPGYFKAVEPSNTMKVVLRGEYNKAPADAAPEYVTVKWEKEITNCKAGQWRKISINVVNADQGNVQFQLTVENWVYDEKVDVDVMSLYVPTEETIPDEDISDPDSPVVTLDGKDINNGYTISSNMYDESLNKWKENMKILVTPVAESKVKSVEMVFTSDNEEFMAALEAAGYISGKIDLFPVDNDISSYLVINESSSTGAVSVTLNDKGMSGLFGYKGNHKVKFIAKDDHYRVSYTNLDIKVLEGGIVVTGPEITWTSKDGSKTYDFDKRYNHDEVEILINVKTQSAFTGFHVEIKSDILTPSELEGVGLSDKLDLLNPGQYEDALKGLGFPVGAEISGSQNVKFDITSFMSLITMLNKSGYCDFKLIVTDESGTTERTIQLDVSVN